MPEAVLYVTRVGVGARGFPIALSVQSRPRCVSIETMHAKHEVSTVDQFPRVRPAHSPAGGPDARRTD